MHYYRPSPCLFIKKDLKNVRFSHLLLMNVVIIDLEEQMHLNIHFVILAVQKGQLEFCYLLQKWIFTLSQCQSSYLHMNRLNHCSFDEIFKQVTSYVIN